ncbi:MAG: hypothetical protein L0Z62_16555 [Gemmataceae bacterium]|nr:hypothetical protein [Gemmataceae bacterium]
MSEEMRGEEHPDKPIKTFGPYSNSEKDTSLSLSVWCRGAQGEDGKPLVYYSVALEKSYRTQGGELKRTSTIRWSEIPLAILLYEQAQAFINALKAE